MSGTHKIASINQSLIDGEERKFAKGGDFIYFLESPEGFQIRFDDGQFLDFETSMGVQTPFTFDSFTIKNTLGNGVATFKIFYGTGNFLVQVATTLTLDAATITSLKNVNLNDIERLAGRGALVDGSGTLAVAGVQDTALAGNATRDYLFVQNVSASDDLWVNFGINATESEPSIKLLPGGSIVFEDKFVPDGFVAVIGATINQPYVVKEH